MRGYVKCDICGKFYTGDDNERYDGLAVFYYGNSGTLCPCSNGNIIEHNGDDSGIPLRIDMCHDCFDKFVNWAKICKEDTENQEVNKCLRL